MCGIAGIWGEYEAGAVERMVAAMRHRGPDDSGIAGDHLVGLGMARLAVIDLQQTGHQPMANPEQTVWIVYNGEVANFVEERALLEQQGMRFRSTSDTEVLLRLYERYGDDFLLRLRGMFALAIYDRRPGAGKERLLLARDPLGIKPLLFAVFPGKLVFASELKALLAGGLVDRTIDPVALRSLLTHGSVYQPRTMLQQVKMLLPAHRMIVENSGMRMERYWSLARDRVSGLRSQPYADQVWFVSQALAASVRRQMISDAPLGAFLSGGIDSSLLVALMAREAGKRVKTFSIGFEAEGADIDESQDAASVARFLGTDHCHVLVRSSEVSNSILDIATALDQPSVDGVNGYFVSRAARQGMTVAVSGTGSDELFAGYPWFRTMAQEQALPDSPWSRMLAAVSRQPAFDSLLQTRFRWPIARARAMSGFLSRFALQYRIFGSTGAAFLIAPALRRQAQAGRAEHYDLEPGDDLVFASPIERVTGLCLSGYTRNQLLRDTDAVSMAHSLEVRVPYLDREIVDLALSLPDASKIDPAPTGGPPGSYAASGIKRILVDVARPLLPDGFDLRRKRGFAMPFAHWLLGPLKDVMRETLSADCVLKRGWLDPKAARAVGEDFSAGRSGWAQPWLLMMLELWGRQVLDRRMGA